MRQNSENKAALGRSSTYADRYRIRWMRTMVPLQMRIAWINCPHEDLFNALEPAVGSIMIVLPTIDEAETLNNQLQAVPDTPTFDIIITESDFLTTTQHPLARIALINRLFHEHTRWICYRTHGIGRLFKRTLTLSQAAYHALIAAAGYDRITQSFSGITTRGGIAADIINGIVAATPGLRIFSTEMAYILRQQPQRPLDTKPSVSIIMPCRNESGSIAHAVARMPQLGSHTELIAIEGNSSDNTLEQLSITQAATTHITMHVMVQTGKGKQNAVVEACARAQGAIIIIFDGDMTLAPEDLRFFYEAIATGRADCANGSRLYLPMQSDAMRWPNWCANLLIARLMSWPLGQKVSDTLCGTKAFWRIDYEKSLIACKHVWDLDPFGDFAFLLSCSSLGGKILDIPITYYNRIYGRPLQGSFWYGLQLWRIGMYALIIRFVRPHRAP